MYYMNHSIFFFTLLSGSVLSRLPLRRSRAGTREVFPPLSTSLSLSLALMHSDGAGKCACCVQCRSVLPSSRIGDAARLGARLQWQAVAASSASETSRRYLSPTRDRKRVSYFAIKEKNRCFVTCTSSHILFFYRLGSRF